MTGIKLFSIALIVIVVAGPAMLWLAGRRNGRHAVPDADRVDVWQGKWTIISSLLYILAFNLTFFLQEFFLVLPKALTPGLRPILFHNNHSWDGINPLADLFQGTGAMATVIVGVLCAFLLRHDLIRSRSTRLFLFWMAFSGVFMALPQVAVGAISEQSDLGMFMRFLGVQTSSRIVLGLLALVCIPVVAILLSKGLLDRVAEPSQSGSAKARQRFLFRFVTLPGMLAVPAITLFRIPREWVEVVMVPIVVTVIGLVWIQASAWWLKPGPNHGHPATGSITWPLGAVMCLLVFFQLVLRPGIPFY